jgi:hypothetical protein
MTVSAYKYMLVLASDVKPTLFQDRLLSFSCTTQVGSAIN